MSLRTVFVILCASYIAIYCHVTTTALIASGWELVRMPIAWYAMIAPECYVLFCLITARVRTRAGLLIPMAVIVHMAALPAVWFSFLHLGVLLPAIGVLWIVVVRQSPTGSTINTLAWRR